MTRAAWRVWQRIELTVFAAALAVVLALIGSVLLYGEVARAQTPGDVLPVHITTYSATGNPTYSGQMPYEGSAGCSADIPLFSVFALPDGRTVVCNDRGADSFMSPHLDVYCNASPSVCAASVPGAGNWTIPQPVTVITWGG